MRQSILISHEDVRPPLWEKDTVISQGRLKARTATQNASRKSSGGRYRTKIRKLVGDRVYVLVSRENKRITFVDVCV